MPGIWEIVLILVIVGWVVIPLFQKKSEALRGSGENGQLNHKKAAYKPPKDAKSVDYEEAEDS